jgi:hypothetical protein
MRLTSVRVVSGLQETATLTTIGTQSMSMKCEDGFGIV